MTSDDADQSVDADYSATIDWLMDFADFERGSLPRRSQPTFALDRIRSLLRRVGDPQLGPRTVHIAGSKGKGSTAATVESVLRAAGLRTGMFTSPHLHSFRERIVIDGALLPLDEFTALAGELRPHVEAELAALPGHISTFELLTAMAFIAFRRHAVDVQIVEVGLGGRLDCTNVFREKNVGVITSLSHEHTEILGDRIEQIAAEKAGILTAGTHAAVLAPQRSEAAAAVVRNAADGIPTPLVDVAAAYAWEPAGVEPWGQWFRLTRRRIRPGEAEQQLLLTPLLGDYQIENAVSAIAALDLLRAQGLEIPNAAVHTGLATVNWPARLEELQWPETPAARPMPRLVVDGAHNGESVRRALEALDSYFPHERLVLVLGVLGDKALDAIVAAVTERASAIVLTASDHPRARPADDLSLAFAGWDGTVAVAPSVEAALAAARELAEGEGDLVAVLGSLSLAADARACVHRLADGPTREADNWAPADATAETATDLDPQSTS